MTQANSPVRCRPQVRGRAVMHALALGGTVLLAACSGAPTAPTSPAAAATTTQAAAVQQLEPADQKRVARSGYMLSSGRAKE